MLRPITEFSLEEHAGPYETWPGKSALYADTVPTDCTVPGYVIEGQYSWDGGFLLITSYDCPSEESQEFVLLDSSFQFLSKKSLGVMHGSYLLMSHQVVSDDGIELLFAGGERWRLQVRPGKWPACRRLRLQRQSSV
jgi:hypothetical protein